MDLWSTEDALDAASLLETWSFFAGFFFFSLSIGALSMEQELGPDSYCFCFVLL